ncbi:hypothetical protein Moror_1909 [Moniliophthora roreri MCA 2997]|uniref:Uncharacterized protein n=2 Tax=Moniliophthora roreri TaxID=221103 RepID=V2Y7K9_MONRO|nr:hypothetical protein Moror_1909 [Moniliophthora roreri MCA 2997]
MPRRTKVVEPPNEVLIRAMALARTGKPMSAINATIFKEEIKKVDEKLEAARNSRQPPKCKITALEHERNAYTSLFAPIRKLSNEDLRMILIYSVERNVFGVNTHSDAPKLTKVYVHWARIAVSTPMIWTHVALDLDFGKHISGYWEDENEEEEDSVFGDLKRQLRRSRDLPLHVEVRLSCELNCGVPCEEGHYRLAEIVGKHSGRWSSFKFFSDDVFVEDEFTSFLSLMNQQPFSSLARLEMEITLGDHGLGLGLKPNFVLEHFKGGMFPELHDIRLTGSAEYFDPQTLADSVLPYH